MPTNRITMRQIRESLRLHLHGGLSYNEVGRCLKISKSVVGKYMSLARVAGVDWAIAQTLTDEELEARLYQPAVPRSSYQLAPDFANVHLELKRAGVTLQLLWEEYAKDNALAYKYTSFCVKYREWAMGLKRSMLQIHIAGEKLFVDYAGQTVPIIDATTGEITKAQIFVASFARRLTQLAKLDLLIIDDFAISPMGAPERNDLLELLDDRIGTRSTLITSQLPVKDWHTYLNDPTLADAILDRVVHSSYKIPLKATKSMRETADEVARAALVEA